MSDVYVIHASEDDIITGEIVDLLKKHWDVWWDDTLVGDFVKVVQREMARTKCAVVVLSQVAVEKDTVIDEMRLAKEAGITIIPVILDDAKLPYPYGALGRVNFKTWDKSERHNQFQKLLRKISTVAPRRVPSKRPYAVEDTFLTLPALFLSVSSHETQLEPLEAVRALRVFGAQTVLISAYDLWKDRRPPRIELELEKIRKADGVVLIDSGNYEATRRGDAEWLPENFHESLEGIPHDWAYCYDVMEPSDDVEVAAQQVIDAVRRDEKATGSRVLPIVHAHHTEMGFISQQLPNVVRKVADVLRPPILAVAERELGRGLIERAETVRAIRQGLSVLPFYQPLHCLGTGNPWSIALLAAAGADSFDGLEWCRMVVDHATHRLNHYQHYDFFTYQTEFSDSRITLAAMEDDSVGYAGKVTFHNLDYYRTFAARLIEYAHSGRMEAFMMKILGDGATSQVTVRIPEIFAR